MKTIKQILSEADKVDLADNIDLLAEVGLFEEKRLNLIKRALNKNPNNMTMAEAKALKEFTDVLTEEILCEKQDHLSKYDKRFSGKHTEQELPTVIILKRKAIRVYPDNQKVALYYSQSLDRYISIPYGPKGEPLGMTMNESVDTKVSPEDGNKIPSGNAKSPSAREMQKDVDTSDILKNMKQNEPENPRLKFAPGMKLNEISSELMKRYIEKSKKKDEDGTRKLNGGMVALAKAKLKTKKSDELTKVLNTPTKQLVRTPDGNKKGREAILQSSAPGAEKLGALFGLAARNNLEKIKARFAGNGNVVKRVPPKQIPNKQFPTAPQAPMGMFESKNTFRKNLQQIREDRLNEADNWQDKTKAFGYGVARGVTFGGSDWVAKKLGGDPEKYEKENPTASSAGEWTGIVGGSAIPIGAGLSAARGAVKGAQAAKMVAQGLGKKAGAGALAKGALKGAGRSKGGRALKTLGRGAKKVAGAVGGALGAVASALGNVDLSDVKKPTDQNIFKFGAVPINIGGRTQRIDMSDAAQQQRMFGQGTVGQFSGPALRESNISLIKKLSKSKSLSESVIHFSDENSVTINKGTAKKVMKIYNSLNEDNKKKIERMLSEDITSFKQAINFIVRH